MQISSSHNLPIIPGYNQQAPARPSPPQQPPADNKQTAPASSQAQPVGRQTAVRPTIQVQPLFDQSLTYRGEQARRAYQNVEMGGEIELLHRLDESA